MAKLWNDGLIYSEDWLENQDLTANFWGPAVELQQSLGGVNTKYARHAGYGSDAAGPTRDDAEVPIQNALNAAGSVAFRASRFSELTRVKN